MNLPFLGSDTAQQACLSWWCILSHWHVNWRLKEHHGDEEKELLQWLSTRQKPCWPTPCRTMLFPWFPTASERAERAGSSPEIQTSQKCSPAQAIKPDIQVVEILWQYPTEDKALQSLPRTISDAPFPSMRCFSPTSPTALMCGKGSFMGPAAFRSTVTSYANPMGL